MTEVRELLEKGFRALNLALDVEPFVTYMQLLTKWNKVYNLTAITNLQDMVVLHILDSLAIMPFIKPNKIIDVGCGAGIPGIPLALACKDQEFVLVDASSKKISFVNEVKRQLKLNNVIVENCRVEHYQSAEKFDTIVTRAFSSLKNMVKITKHLAKKNGIFLAMKGKTPNNELMTLDFDYEVKQYTVPQLASSRCCVVIFNK